MPNWVTCDATISASDPARLCELHGRLVCPAEPGSGHDHTLNFEAIIHIPKGVTDYAPFWGTKWAPEWADVRLAADDEDPTLRLEFQTANNPPLPIFAELARRFGVVVHLDWLDTGADEGGRAEYVSGNSTIILASGQHWLMPELREALGGDFYKDEGEG